jgi:hypothetical protein
MVLPVEQGHLSSGDDRNIHVVPSTLRRSPILGSALAATSSQRRPTDMLASPCSSLAGKIHLTTGFDDVESSRSKATSSSLSGSET